MVSMRVNLARGGTYANTGGACNNIGALFTMESNAWSAPFPNPPGPTFGIRDYAHVFSTAVISDTAHWTLVSGEFVADSAYRHIVLGNFFSNANTDTIPSEIGYVLAYYLFDSVSVSSGLDDCPTTIVEASFKHHSSIGLDASTKDVIISDADGNEASFIVYDTTGRIMKAGRFRDTVRISTASWPAGIYLATASRTWEKTVFKFTLDR